MQFELVSYPDGKAYERDAAAQLWHPGEAGRVSAVQNERMTRPSIPRNGAGTRIAAELREAILDGHYAPGRPDAAGGPGRPARREPRAGARGAPDARGRGPRHPRREHRRVGLAARAWPSARRCTRSASGIEPLLLRYSIPHLADDDVDRLELLADAMERSTDVEEFLRLDREFHLSCYAGRRHQRARRHGRAAVEPHPALPPRVHPGLPLGGRPQRRTTSTTCSSPRSARDDIDEAERVLHGHIRRTRLELARHPEVFEH